MDRDEKIRQICRALEVTVRGGQRMSNHTSLGVGGLIDCIVYPETREAAARLTAEFDDAGVEWSPLGTGSNLIAADEPISRAAISLKLIEELLTFDGTRARMHGGYRLSRAAAGAADRGLIGLENFGALPGSIGSAIRARKSAGDVEIVSLIESVAVARNGEAVNVEVDEIGANEIILGCVLRLQEADSAMAKKQLARSLRRAKKGPADAQTVGPVFKPIKGKSPARLISRLGLKGASRGQAAIAEWDSNFLVNTGGAEASEVFELIDFVRDEARKRSRVELELALDVWR